MTSQPIRVVQQWHQALNHQNLEQLASLVKEEVKLIGPRGSFQGVTALLDWVGRAQMTLTPHRYFQRNHLVGVEELGEWHDPETGEVTGSQVVTTIFVVEDGVISRIARYADREEAFETVGLHEEHEVFV